MFTRHARAHAHAPRKHTALPLLRKSRFSREEKLFAPLTEALRADHPKLASEAETQLNCTAASDDVVVISFMKTLYRTEAVQMRFLSLLVSGCGHLNRSLLICVANVAGTSFSGHQCSYMRFV